MSAAYFFALMFFGWGNTLVIYWLAMSDFPAAEIAMVLFIFSQFYFYLTLILNRKSSVNTQPRVIVLLAFVSSAFLFCASFASFWHTGVLGFREHIASARLHAYTYNLQFYSSDYVETYTHRYQLYRCLVNTICTEIYSIQKSDSEVDTIELSIDEAEDAVLLVINNEVVFSYPQ